MSTGDASLDYEDANISSPIYIPATPFCVRCSKELRMFEVEKLESIESICVLLPIGVVILEIFGMIVEYE